MSYYSVIIIILALVLLYYLYSDSSSTSAAASSPVLGGAILAGEQTPPAETTNYKHDQVTTIYKSATDSAALTQAYMTNIDSLMAGIDTGTVAQTPQAIAEAQTANQNALNIMYLASARAKSLFDDVNNYLANALPDPSNIHWDQSKLTDLQSQTNTLTSVTAALNNKYNQYNLPS